MMHNPFSLEGKMVLITGASSGIGRATAIECSRLGATCIICGRNEVRLQETLDALEGTGHTTFIGELTDNEVLQSLVAQVPMLDGVVLCAGIGMTRPFGFCTPEKFNQVYQVNLFSPIELLRLLYRKKKLNKGCSVVAVTSIAAFNAVLGNSVYGSAKAALSRMMKYIAREFAPNIRVNCVCPGMVMTPLTSAENSSVSTEQMEQDAQQYPMKRYGQPEEVAYGIIYLLSDAAAWVTGTDLRIDGGIGV